MAAKTYYIDKRVFVTSTDSTLGIQNRLNLKEYIQEVVEDSATEFTSINADAIVEKTAAHGVDVDGLLIKDGGAMVFTGQGLFSVNLIKSNEQYYRYTLIWEKTKAGGFLNAKRMPLQAHEDILVFYKKLPTYNPQMIEGKPYTKKAVTNGDGKNYGKFDRVGTVNINDGTRSFY